MTAITSNKKYWYHVRFRPWDFKCAAPLCRITYSVQYTTDFSGVIGRSLNIFKAIFAFSVYLKSKYQKKKKKCINDKLVYILYVLLSFTFRRLRALRRFSKTLLWSPLTNPWKSPCLPPLDFQRFCTDRRTTEIPVPERRHPLLRKFQIFPRGWWKV